MVVRHIALACHRTSQVHGKRVLNPIGCILNILVSCQSMAKVSKTNYNEMSQIKRWNTRCSRKMQRGLPLRGQKTDRS